MLMQKKVAVVTGGSRGIGKAIVEKFLNEGAVVYYISRTECPDPALSSAIWKQASVSDSKQVTEVIESILKKENQIDVLVNNAGITNDGLSFLMKDEAWQSVIETNLSSVFYLSRPVARAMAKNRSGSIINISSVVGLSGNAGQCNYAASKAGIIGLTKSMAKETAARGVRINAVAPGFIASDMTDKIPEKLKDEFLKKIPMACVGRAQDVANAVLFLASDMSLYITGQVLVVDGGLNI